ncbi:MAG: DnrP protein [Gammaproteobacteria bacterium]|nr:DnrP protein [Gammaproteobacteria bacterium]MBL6999940.1 DnrP protein [Gammaproteobacteria bacterium]
MTEIDCRHCGTTYEEEQLYCPNCRTPSPAQQQQDFNRVKNRFIYFVIGLTIFCAIMIVWLPRVFRS